MSGMPLNEIGSKAGWRRTALLQQGHVGMPAQRVHTRKDIGEVLAQIVHRDLFAVVAQEG